MAQARCHIFLTPFLVNRSLLFFDALKLFRVIDQPIGRIGPAIEKHILHVLEQFLVDLFIDLQHAGIDDAHVQPGPHGVIEKRRVHRLTDHIVATEGKRNVTHATACAHARATLLHLPHGLDKIDRVIVMLLHAGGDGEDVEIKNDVFWWKIQLPRQQCVSALGDGHLVLNRRRLAFFVKSHDHGRRPIAPAQSRLPQELLLAALKADGVDDALALQALEALLQHAPLGAIDHNRHTRDVRIGREQV